MLIGGLGHPKEHGGRKQPETRRCLYIVKVPSKDGDQPALRKRLRADIRAREVAPDLGDDAQPLRHVQHGQEQPHDHNGRRRRAIAQNLGQKHGKCRIKDSRDQEQQEQIQIRLSHRNVQHTPGNPKLKGRIKSGKPVHAKAAPRQHRKEIQCQQKPMLSPASTLAVNSVSFRTLLKMI